MASERDFLSSEPCFFAPFDLSIALLRHVSMARASSAYTQPVQITGQLFPRKQEPKISSRRTGKRDGEKKSQREITEILVYPLSFYTLCCRGLTGS